MSNKKRRCYWDACCFIDLIQQTTSRIEVLEQLRSQAQRGEIDIVTSSYTLAEVIKDDKGAPVNDDDEQRIATLFLEPYIGVRLLHRQVGNKARQIARAHSLKPGDAIHVATAILEEADVLHTYDEKRLLKRNGVIGDPPLRIERPSVPQLEIPNHPAREDDATT